MDQSFKILQPSVILGVAAHPDDLDFGASATMAKFAAAGAKIYYLLLTDGSKGSDDQQLSSSQLINIRQAEQQAALKEIGGKEVTFLSYPDSALEISMELKKAIVREIRRLKPDVVVTIDPTVIYSTSRGYVNHPDHRAAGQATLDAVFPLARDYLTYPDLISEGLMPHKVSTVLLINFDYQNYYVDISKTLDQKLRALKAHASQIKDFKAIKLRFTQLASDSGKKAGYDYAEGFIRLDLPL